MATKTEPTLVGAAQALAARDGDFATALNGQGFNKADTYIGQALAATDQATWGAEVEYGAWVMLRKYRGQLAGYGIDFDAIPVPQVPLASDEARGAAREFAYTYRVHKRAAERRTANQPRIVMSGDDFDVRFPYDDEMVAGIREVPKDARAWDRDLRRWIVRPAGAAVLAVWAERFGAAMSEGARHALAAFAEWAEAEAAKPPCRVELDGDKALVFFPYAADIVAIMRTITGATFNRGATRWEVPLARARKLVELESKGFVVASELVAAVEAADAVRGAKVDASRALDADLDIAGIREGLALHPFQKAGIRYLLEHADGRGIIGDEMGLGKTPQTMLAVQAADAFPALIVVPNLVKINWLRELDLWLPGRSITLLDSKGEVKAGSFRKHALAGGGRRTITLNDTTADFMVVNYDILKKVLPRFTGTKLGAVIYDEAHYLKNPKAQRTIAAGSFARLAKLRLMATGTAILNRPIELLSPLTILGRIGELGGSGYYQRRYCDGHVDGLGHWDVSGASHLDELNERLREVCYVRRDKRDVLTELPPVQRQSVLLPITNRAEYRRAEKDVVEWARTQAAADSEFRATLTGLSKAEREAAVKKHADEVGKRAESAEALRRMTALRRLTGEGKIEAVKEWAAEFVEQGEKLILFTWHVDVQRALLDAFPTAARVLADDAPQVRDEQVRRFQEDASVPLIVISLSVGGVGLTITAAHHVAFVELPWRPGDVDQAEGRAYGRLNDAHGISSYYLLGEDTFDLDMADLIDAKRAVTDAVNSGTVGASGESIMASLVARMAERQAEAA
jgi:SWI/SNF-related matrix-associated actin-dependent regulator 1 of chromatin subfamily A